MTVYKVCVCHRSKEEVSVTLMEPVVVSAQLLPVAVSDSWMKLSNNDVVARMSPPAFLRQMFHY